MPIQPFATQIQPPQIQPVNAMAQVGQLMAMRNAQQENALRDLQMGQLKQGIEQENALRAFLGSGADLSTPEARRQLLGHGKPGADVLKLLREADSADLTTRKTGLDIANTITQTYRDNLSTLNTDDPQAFLTGFANATRRVHSDPVMKRLFEGTEASAEQSIREALTAAQEGPAAMRALIARNTMNAQMFQDRLKPRLMQVEDLTGQSIVSAAPGQTGVTTVARFGPKPRRADTTAPKPLTAREELRLRQDMGKSYGSVNQTISLMDEVKNAVEAVRKSSGKDAATGLSAYVPSLPGSPASQTDQAIANLRGKLTALGRSTAALSGAIGPMAVQEWKIVADQIAALDPAKMDSAMLEDQLQIIEDTANTATANTLDQYETTYEDYFERFPKFEIKEKKVPVPGGPKTTAPTSGTSSADGVDTNNPLLVKQK